MRLAILATSVLLATALHGCATTRGRADVCPEYRDLRCLTQPICEVDRARGCQACRCADAPMAPPPGYAPGAADRPSDSPPSWTPQGQVERR